MTRYARISIDDADNLIAQQPVTIVDIRDAISTADQSIPLIVCCYHGNMSQSAGEMLAEQGFSEVYSLNGGFAAWAASFPESCEPPLA